MRISDWSSDVCSSDLPATGDTFELNAIAAAVLGGAPLAGGRGTIVGTLVGAAVIGVLGDGMVMMGVSAFWQMVLKGLVIIAAVLLAGAQARLPHTVATRRAAAPAGCCGAGPSAAAFSHR